MTDREKAEKIVDWVLGGGDVICLTGGNHVTRERLIKDIERSLFYCEQYYEKVGHKEGQSENENVGANDTK